MFALVVAIALPASRLPLGLVFPRNNGFCMQESVVVAFLQCVQEIVDADQRMALIIDHGKPLRIGPFLQRFLKAMDQRIN